MSSFNRLKPKQVPYCNKEFIFKAIKENKRIDNREPREFRPVSIGFGLEFGSSIVSLGKTKVMCNINYQILEPKTTKPCEGLLKIKLDLSSLLFYNYEKCVEIMRIIEKNIKDSKCLDLESLCLISNEKVYQLEVDLIAINNEGNIAECCSIALLSSLAHYRRPDVTVIDNQLKIHSYEERHPLPLNILHYPFCTSFVFFDDSKFVCDPTQTEEQICNGYLIIGANLYHEITTIHISGRSSINKSTVLTCSHLAIERCKYLTNLMKAAIEEDLKKRSAGAAFGFVPLIKEKSSVLCGFRKEEIELFEEENTEEEINEIKNFDEARKTKLFRFAPDTVSIGEGGKSSWNFIQDLDDEDNEVDQELDEQELKRLKEDREALIKKIKYEIKNESSSEEDEVQILQDCK